MPFVETELWAMEIPEEWTALLEEDIVCISDPDEIGSLDVSALCKEEGEVSMDDLNAFAEELLQEGKHSEVIAVGDISGLYFEYSAEGMHWREWFLRHDNKKDLLLFATYTCDLEQAGMDDVVIDQMLETLAPAVNN